MSIPPFDSRYAGPEESPGFLLWQVSNLWQRHQRAALDTLDLTHVQFVLLANIVWMTRFGEVITQSQLASQTAIDLMMISDVVRTLERKGLVERAPHPTDARAKRLQATHVGADLVKEAITVVEQVDAAFFGVLGKDLTQFTRALQQLIQPK